MSEIEIVEVVDAEFVDPVAQTVWIREVTLTHEGREGSPRRLTLDLKIEGSLPSADELGAAIAVALRETRVFR